MHKSRAKNGNNRKWVQIFFISVIKLILSIFMQEISINQRFLKFRVFASNMIKHAELKNGIYRLRKRVFDLGKKHFKAEKLYFNTE